MNPLHEKMAELAARFARRAPTESAEIAQALAAGNRDQLADRAHKLAGIAGMFGHPEIGEVARELEDAARGGGDCDPACERLLAMLDAL